MGGMLAGLGGFGGEEEGDEVLLDGGGVGVMG